MNFDKRFNDAMEHLLAFNSRPPKSGTRVVEPGVDVEARETILALQSQVEAVQRGMATLHGWLISDKGGKMKGSELDQLLTVATDIKPLEFPQAVLHTASQIDLSAPRKAAGSGRKERMPKIIDQPASLNEWFRRFSETVGVVVKHHQVLYRHARFEQPKIIFLLNTDAEHQKIINWTHSKVLDYAIQYGTEEGTEQNWLYLPVAALVEHGLALPEGAEDDLRKG